MTGHGYDFDKEAWVLPDGDYAYWTYLPDLNIMAVKLGDVWWFTPARDGKPFPLGFIGGPVRVPDTLVDVVEREMAKIEAKP